MLMCSHCCCHDSHDSTTDDSRRDTASNNISVEFPGDNHASSDQYTSRDNNLSTNIRVYDNDHHSTCKYDHRDHQCSCCSNYGTRS
jgi:hypothetical protein